MVDLIKKAFYTGLGLAVLTKEKAEELVKDFAEQAKLSEHEGKELVDSMMKQSDQARNDFQAGSTRPCRRSSAGSTWRRRTRWPASRPRSTSCRQGSVRTRAGDRGLEGATTCSRVSRRGPAAVVLRGGRPLRGSSADRAAGTHRCRTRSRAGRPG